MPADLASSFRVTKVRAPLFRHPAPLPRLGRTILIGTPARGGYGTWEWSARRNGQPLTEDEADAYKARTLLVIGVPNLLADLSLADLLVACVTEEVA